MEKEKNSGCLKIEQRKEKKRKAYYEISND